MTILRPYQVEAEESINRFFLAGYGNPLVVAPTGSGKSVILASYISQTIKDYPQTRMMVLAHVKELLEQDHDAITDFNHSLDVGLYSAGLKRNDLFNAVIVAGIQSVADKAEHFGFIDVLIIDECHLINPKNLGRYRTFIRDLKQVNPNIKVVGFTATPYRLGHGWIHKGDTTIFDGIAHDIPIEMLIADGYLVRPVAKSGKVHADLTNVHIRAGEYVEAEAAEAFEKITVPAVKDIISRTQSQKCGLIFCSGLRHAASVKMAFESLGEYSVDVVSGKTKAKERESLVQRVKNGDLKWLINVAVFTTGFDAPNIDTIVFLRATQSTSLYVQMIGRGLRIADHSIGRLPSKEERLLTIASSIKPTCLVLDYGENVQRHGPLNYLSIKEPGQKRDPNEIRAKDCPKCEELIPVNCRECPVCGFVFPIEHRNPNHATTAAEAELLISKEPQWLDVNGMSTRKHTKHGKKISSMKVSYQVGLLKIDEWVCFDHGGYASKQATKWAKERGCQWMSTERALQHEWPIPKRIRVKKRPSGYYDVLECDWAGERKEK